MELKLNTKEVETILLDWAEKNFPGQFNEISIYAQYGSFRHVEFSKIDPAPVPLKVA